MHWLGVATQLVELSLCWYLATLLGGVVLGWLPASVALGRSIVRMISDGPSGSPWGDFWEDLRSMWRRANRLGWPATLALVLVLIDWLVLRQASGAVAAAMRVPTALVALCVSAAIGYAITLIGHLQPVPRLTQLWRQALALPVVSWASSLAWLVTTLALALVIIAMPLVGLLLGPSLLLGATVWVSHRRLDQLCLL